MVCLWLKVSGCLLFERIIYAPNASQQCTCVMKCYSQGTVVFCVYRDNLNECSFQIYYCRYHITRRPTGSSFVRKWLSPVGAKNMYTDNDISLVYRTPSIYQIAMLWHKENANLVKVIICDDAFIHLTQVSKCPWIFAWWNWPVNVIKR